MHLGSIQLDNHLALAPMAGVSDKPFRQVCRSLGAGLAVSEMISADPRLWHSDKTRSRLDHHQEPDPIAVQIAGADPRLMARAAAENEALGAQIIDINMGCPAKKVCRRAAGSALLRDLSLVSAIIKAVTASVSVPVTLKIRTGWDTHHRNALDVARIAEQHGISGLAIHGRTRACRFAGQAEYDTIRQVVKTVSIPIFANGDINSPQKARHVLEYTGASGIMVGRAAQGNPWIFRDIRNLMETGTLPPAPRSDEVRETILAHIIGLHELYGKEAGLRVARKHLGWYSHYLPGGSLFRQEINHVTDASKQLAAIGHFFEKLESGSDRLKMGHYRLTPDGVINGQGDGARAA